MKIQSITLKLHVLTMVIYQKLQKIDQLFHKKIIKLIKQHKIV